MAFMGPSHWLSDPDGAEAASEKEFFGWTGASASAQPFLRWRPRRIAERASAYAGKHDMARAVRMALEAEWDGHEVFFISNKDSRCLRPTREVLERWYAHLSTVLVEQLRSVRSRPILNPSLVRAAPGIPARRSPKAWALMTVPSQVRREAPVLCFSEG